ncbi:hypothetical protein Tco_1576680 [Tanacetum coccineum]
MNEEKCKPENLKNLKKEENEMQTYDKDEKLEEINNGGKQSCGKGNSKNRRGKNEFRLWQIKMRALMIQQGCDAALETLPADMEAGEKTALMKKAYNTLIL